MHPSPLRSRASRSLALTGAGALVLLASSPGVAATPVAQADATGLTITLLNSPISSGTVKATHNGTKETVTGESNPLITVLGGQQFISTGTISQDATATVVQRNGRSAACAGLAGDGATLATVGDGFCITPGDNATINAGTFQLEGTTIVQSDLLAGLDAVLLAALQPLIGPVTNAADTVVQTLLESLADPTVGLDLGAVQSQCNATPTGAQGDSQITDAQLFVDFPDFGRFDLVSLPTNAPPNTKLLTDLDVVVAAISDALEEQLATGLAGALAPAGPLVGQLTAALNDNIIAALSDQLGPLEDNILDVTLNKQTRGPRSIEVTALDLSLLPAASDFVTLADVEIGRVSCGPNRRAGDPNPPTDDPNPPTGDPNPPTDPTPDVPTSVPAGESDQAGRVTSDGAINGRIATGALVLMSGLAAAGGFLGFRRALRS